MRKINVSMDMFGKQKKRGGKKKKKRKWNRICYYEDLTPSWQGSINVLPTFVHSFFCVGEGISFLAQWLDNPIYIYIYIVEVIKGFHMNLALKNLIQKITWKLSKLCFEAWWGTKNRAISNSSIGVV